MRNSKKLRQKILKQGLAKNDRFKLGKVGSANLTAAASDLEQLFQEAEENKPPLNIKKFLLLLGLGTLSWISTYTGLLELIRANAGEIDFIYKAAIGFAVAMLMLMIVYILDQLFTPMNWTLRTTYVGGYIFLTIISVGFGFGFYWKFLESRQEATRSAESAVTQVQTALQGGQTRLEQLQTTLAALTAISTQKAIDEREKGNSCPNSRPGDGPRRRLRDNDAKNFAFAGNFITERSQTMKSDIAALNKDLAKVVSRDKSTIDPKTGTRNAFLKGLGRRLDMTITRFNAFRTDPQLQTFRNNFAGRAEKTIFANGRGGTFQCPDQQLQSALRGVVYAIDKLPTLAKPKIAAVEGSEATIEAFRRLTATMIGTVTLKLPPSEDKLRDLRAKAVRSQNNNPALMAELKNIQAGLGERDYIPLAIAIFVDFCLLLVSINRPMDRLKSLVPVMKEARDGPMGSILQSFHTTHFEDMGEELSLFQHVVFDWGGHYYIAVPLAAKDIQAQYLTNLMVSLEGKGIVDRALIPPAFIIRSKLRKMESSFADHHAFRLYKFREGAWSNIVLDAVMGTAKKADQKKAINEYRERVAEAEQNKMSNSFFGHFFNSRRTDHPKPDQIDEQKIAPVAPSAVNQEASYLNQSDINHPNDRCQPDNSNGQHDFGLKTPYPVQNTFTNSGFNPGARTPNGHNETFQTLCDNPFAKHQTSNTFPDIFQPALHKEPTTNGLYNLTPDSAPNGQGDNGPISKEEGHKLDEFYAGESAQQLAEQEHQVISLANKLAPRTKERDTKPGRGRQLLKQQESLKQQENEEPSDRTDGKKQGNHTHQKLPHAQQNEPHKADILPWPRSFNDTQQGQNAPDHQRTEAAYKSVPFPNHPIVESRKIDHNGNYKQEATQLPPSSKNHNFYIQNSVHPDPANQHISQPNGVKGKIYQHQNFDEHIRQKIMHDLRHDGMTANEKIEKNRNQGIDKPFNPGPAPHWLASRENQHLNQETYKSRKDQIRNEMANGRIKSHQASSTPPTTSGGKSADSLNPYNLSKSQD